MLQVVLHLLLFFFFFFFLLSIDCIFGPSHSKPHFSVFFYFLFLTHVSLHWSILRPQEVGVGVLVPDQVVIRLDRGIHPGQTVSPSQDTIHAHTHTLQLSRRNPLLTQGEHTDSSQRGPDSGIFSLRGDSAIVPEKSSSMNPKNRPHGKVFTCQLEYVLNDYYLFSCQHFYSGCNRNAISLPSFCFLCGSHCFEHDALAFERNNVLSNVTKISVHGIL